MWWTATVLAAFLFQAPADLQQEAIKAIEAERYTDAVANLQKVAASDPRNAHAHYYLGYALSMLRRDDEAVPAYRKAIELQPDLNPARLNLGLVLMRQKKPAEAVAVLEPLVKANPKEYAPVLALAEA